MACFENNNLKSAIFYLWDQVGNRDQALHKAALPHKPGCLGGEQKEFESIVIDILRISQTEYERQINIIKVLKRMYSMPI